MIAVYKLRTVFVFFCFLLLFSIALVHLFSLQVKQNRYFKDLANRQYHVQMTTYPPRALITDRHDKPLALNRNSISAFILPQALEDATRIKKFLKRWFPSALERWKKNPKTKFLYLKRHLPARDLAAIKQEGLSDVKFLNEPSRFYPLEAAGTVTGITNIDNLGLFGIELQCNEILAGTPTTSTLEKDARSGHFYFSKRIQQKGTEGVPVKLTLDSDLQFLVQEELDARAALFNAQEGAAIVLDPVTGDILAMVTTPIFDPNQTNNIDLATTKNRAVTESYEFGSAIKAFTALAALEEGLVTPDEVIDCENKTTTYVQGRKVNNWEAQGFLTFEEVITRSNNIGIAKVAQRLGPKLYEHYTRLGFGKKTGITFPGEQAGFVNPPHNWSKQSVISLSYGYEITCTLLQLATAFCVFANGGFLVQPRLILKPEQYQRNPEKIYSDQSIDAMRAILEKTTSKEGTARYAAINGYTTMGKTSTANLLVNGQYDPTKNLYGFVGSVERGDYKRVIGCFLKESPRKNLYAATVAAPLFRKILEKLLIHENVITGGHDGTQHSSIRTP